MSSSRLLDRRPALCGFRGLRMMPNLNRLISESLHLPSDAMAWELSRQLRDLYPNSYLLETTDYDFDLNEFAREGGCLIHPVEGVDAQFDARWHRRLGSPQLELRNGFVEVLWKGRRLHVLTVTYDGGEISRYFILADDMSTARGFFEAVCRYVPDPADRILVFEGGRWSKDAGLARAIQACSLDDLTLSPTVRESLHEDVLGFFKSRELYDSLGVTWKRGVLLLGPPGNGKTHAIKGIVREARVQCLYVRSLEDSDGTVAESIATVFRRARAMAPCILVLEDLDSLVPEEARSCLLNEMDGFATNHGILTLATTNYPERIDPALRDRPSRFDRKITFDLPADDARQNYLSTQNQRLVEGMRMSDAELAELARLTEDFSFAYLKELFLSSVMAWMSKREPGQMSVIALGIAEKLRTEMRSPEPDSGQEEEN